MIKCRWCNSDNMRFEKWVHDGQIQGTTFHIKAICLNCRKSFNIPRNKEAFELTKNQGWKRKSKTLNLFE